jgi:hypothetical protein
MVPLGIKLIENWISKKFPSKAGLKLGLISIIAVIFAISSFYAASATFSSMGPSITTEQYNDLVQIKANYLDGKIDPNGIIVVSDYHTGYWVQYITGMQVETGNADEIQEKYPNRTVYALTLTENKQSGSKGSFEYSWNPLLPYSFPFGGFNINTSSNGNQNPLANPPNQISRNNMTAPPSGGLENNTRFNRSSSLPPNFTNMTQNRNIGSANMLDQASNQLIRSRETLIFSADNLKIYKIS